ncbi:Dynein heavy chain and region D6 of dynein motor [Carpediemonas membranifera]|uniref:Dynein heavy chain and region D6 of dynein motor n=1 Tax=Carpediemonas membranifera TaxID=201153 RepID=A0A8J6E458_9EUKA|nr:Dynein heavy chain and region D6 of dynein motor [Carpediemonas membranifera]|eukprot:KAG9396803.1 Dynein heavy chain and region D6 of dynein motor [Carpediemonas membranifera]
MPSDDVDEGFSDARTNWMRARVMTSMKLRESKWIDMTKDDSHVQTLLTFLETDTDRTLVVYIEAGDVVIPTVHFPEAFRKKSVYFTKLKNVSTVTGDNISNELIYGELSTSPLDHLHLFLAQIALPLMNQKNTAEWPSVMVRDVTKHLDKFIAQTTVFAGKMSGRTTLPVPSSAYKVITDSEGDLSNREVLKDAVHSLETVIIDWTREIRHAVQLDTDSIDGSTPGPIAEVDFWQKKRDNLQSISEQLNSQASTAIRNFLAKTGSSFSSALDAVLGSVEQTIVEASDNVTYLEPLRRVWSQVTEETDHQALVGLFTATFHTLLLIHRHSGYYKTQRRITSIVRRMCDELIEDTFRQIVDPETVLKMEPDAACTSLEQVLHVATSFRNTYRQYADTVAEELLEANIMKTPRAGSAHPVPEAAPDKGVRQHWPDEDLVFRRMDNMLGRFNDILGLMKSALQLNKVQKIEVGGMRGKLLSVQLQHIFGEFEGAMEKFTQSEYDPANLRDDSFEHDYQNFRRQVKDWEKRLSAILIQAYDDTFSLEGKCKLVESFSGILDEEALSALVTRKYVHLLQLFHEELGTVEAVFEAYRENPPVPLNMAPVSGRLAWADTLADRIGSFMEKVQAMPADVLETEVYTNLVKPTYARLESMLTDYKGSNFAQWSNDIDKTATEKLKTPLIVRKADGLLSVNFDPVLDALLKEMSFLSHTGRWIPDEAATIYAQADYFRRWTGKLDLIVDQYNYVQKALLPVERPLVKVELTMIDRQLATPDGLLTMMWSTRDDARSSIDRAIEKTRYAVTDLHSKVTQAKTTLEKLSTMLADWAEKPLFPLNNRRTLSLTGEAAEVHKNIDALVHESSIFADTINETAKLLQVRTDQDAWHDYVEFVTEMIAEGISQVVLNSLAHIRERMILYDTDLAPPTPLVDVRMDLIVPEVIFSPPLRGSRDAVITVMSDVILAFLELPRRLKNPTDPDAKDGFLPLIGANPEVISQSEDLIAIVEAKCKEANEFKNTFIDWKPYWVSDRRDYFNRFKKFGSKTSLDGTNDPDEEEDDAYDAPVLDDFDAQIVRFRELENQVQGKNFVSTFSWLRVDGRPLKQALLSTFGKWIYLFTSNLADDINNSLSELQTFVESSTVQLSDEFDEVSQAHLEELMRTLHSIKIRTSTVDSLWSPAKETIAMLTRYDIPIPESVSSLLETLPAAWEKLRRLSYSAKEKLEPRQQEEMRNIRERDVTFEGRLLELKKLFRSRGPFTKTHTATEAYQLIDSFNQMVIDLKRRAKKVQEMQQLFDLEVNEYAVIQNMESELKLLKSVWDECAIVDTQLTVWRRTGWQEIDIEFMEDESKKMAKDIRGLDKALRAFDVFTSLETEVKNFLATLPLVADLKNPAMRDRHWKQLMRVTRKDFTITAKFSLADLLALQLHQFGDEVGDIVDRASKELSMEKTLATLDETWTSMELTFGTYKDGTTPLLQVDEAQIETLEDNQVVVQNMAASKYVAHFQEQVGKWQANLSTVDAVINLWLEVQQTWAHLEPIFIGSADIRQQLQRDAERFDKIDEIWHNLMDSSSHVPNIIELCTKEGLEATLDQLQSMLSECEKALADYLDTKRRAFPRFYFISSTDLLDILSKGRLPLEVEVHLSKLFDSIKSLEWELDDEGQKTDTAVGMYSMENEYIPFAEPCLCQGQVEVWLNKLVEAMRETIRAQLASATEEYLAMDRVEWLLRHPAQIALVGSQIWWTSEVNQAFAKLEEGNETAVKEYNKKQQEQIIALIHKIQGELSKNDRIKIMTITTIDVHARDVVTGLIDSKVETAQSFAWQSQLKLRWDDQVGDCFINIADAEFQYWHEYLGNQPRLVITPLTDRCYITLTQSLHLIMGGAPAGPAGTGKTETTKDLGRALGLIVYVFSVFYSAFSYTDCSEQMDYRSLGNIFQGLASSGAWGCVCSQFQSFFTQFDEFNRISIEVLSVVANQVKSVLDAIRAKQKRFDFQGVEIDLRPTVGIFITMNPGYAGRTELPENIKALFRSCSMVVPDYGLISEIMLMAQGFIDARELAKKFTTLYALNKDLLSAQAHYDWGLRAIKSVLVVAGALKRDEPDVPEEHVLMRALRDFNIPKITLEDMEVFMGLIGDLFPSCDVPRKVNEKLEKIVRECCLERGLQPEDSFVLKVVQLEELLEVRHSVFVLGDAGTGKSQTIRILADTYRARGHKIWTPDINPKAVTGHELYGYITASREWKDGLLSTTMRDLSNIPNEEPKWIILDGDIDPNWIESMNTCMDDNKVLTLASNERIPLHPWMRLIFEISHLKYATPATVSRAGILYISLNDVGWRAVITSWADNRDKEERSPLTALFDKYIPACFDAIRASQFKQIIACSEVQMTTTLTRMLDLLLVKENFPKELSADEYKDVLEQYFVFAMLWAIGGTLFKDQITDHREVFSKWWRVEFKGSAALPAQGSVFDYCLKMINGAVEWVPWDSPDYEHNAEQPVSQIMVHTSESQRLVYWMDRLMSARLPVMLVGLAGGGKTLMMTEKLKGMPDDYMFTQTNLNYFTDTKQLQLILEQRLEKKAGRTYGPPGQRKLVYFIDDLNMSMIDEYGTQAPITLLRQHLDYEHWYDRQKLTLREIKNCQMVAAMNPTAGSFTVNPRLQRHFTVLSVNMPEPDSLSRIYTSILEGHLLNGFNNTVFGMVENIVKTILDLHKRVSTTFLPTAIKFHYQFNLRELSNIIGGLLQMGPDQFKEPLTVARLVQHEVSRVYGDRLTSEDDISLFTKMKLEVVRQVFSDIADEELTAEPIIYSHFALGVGDGNYAPIKNGYSGLNDILEEGLTSYNDCMPVMDLVLFEDAMSHVCRISRIIASGSALLIGVGGSGKQSLARLASFILGNDVVQITITSSYSVESLKEDIVKMYHSAGIKGNPTTFLFTDQQIVEERFLVYINDMLSTGDIADLYEADDRDAIVNQIRNEVKQAGIIDTAENCWTYFIDKVRANLRIVLCFSPVSEEFRRRARRFPAIFSCTSIDWFHPWPINALMSVADRFLAEIESDMDDGSGQMRGRVADFMARADGLVNELAAKYKEMEKRDVFSTPKSFLELISLYKVMFKRKKSEIEERVNHLQSGLTKLETTESDVAELKDQLNKQQEVVEERKKSANELLEVVGKEQAVVAEKKAAADVEADKCAVIAEEVAAIKAECESDLSSAEPVVQAAIEALNTLDKLNLTELKGFTKPANEVVDVAAAVMLLLSPAGKLVKDVSWGSSKKGMGNVTDFLNRLLTFDKDNIPQANIKAIAKYIENPAFNPQNIKAKSVAAAGLCSWVVNIHKYNEIYQWVTPKREALAEAEVKLNAATVKLNAVQKQVKQLNDKLASLLAQFEKASEEKNRVIAEAERTQNKLNLANRLVSGLSSEKVRWRASIADLQKTEALLVGDVLLCAAFVSYIGPFNRQFRIELMDKWIDLVNELSIPHTDGMTVSSMLSDAAMIAEWNNEGLPTDPVSVENACIINTCERWPLIIDPQLQGINWIRQRYEMKGKPLNVVRLNQPKFLDVIERAVTNGEAVIIENIAEKIDAVLDPVIGRQVTRKGRTYFIRIGDKQIEYDQRFELFIQTKMPNPHYTPEIQAQTTLINFTVTPDGLEDQLLGLVVKEERPELEEQMTSLMREQNEYKILLKELEDSLLTNLSNATGDILSNIELIENLEKTKATSAEVNEKVKLAIVTEKDLNATRELYRPVAARSSLLYFLLTDLSKIDHMYQYSLKAFIAVFYRAIAASPACEEVEERVKILTEEITFLIYCYTSMGLFEKHKLIFMTQLCFRIMTAAGTLPPEELDFLLRATPSIRRPDNPIDDWCSMEAWQQIVGLSEISDIFTKLADDVAGSSKRWREWADAEAPEKTKLPQDWKNRDAFQRMLILRCLRPDRLTYALYDYLDDHLGTKYVNGTDYDLPGTFKIMTPADPLFFILSAGVDPVKDFETLGAKLGYSAEKGNLSNVALGQGQEPIAERALERGSQLGHIVILQNIHLMVRWLPKLEKIMEQCCSEDAHPQFRLFLTAEPSNAIPQGILQACIKLTNEPPRGVKANMKRAIANFDQDTLEMCSKANEFKSILFMLCFFHSSILERRKYKLGFSIAYPFNTGDLTFSANVLYNYLESNSNVPWDDLKYLFGEIIYGGHVSNDWDRRVVNTYLDVYMQDTLFEDFELCPGFKAPPAISYDEYVAYIEEQLPEESPKMFGLHPNAELGFLTEQSGEMFNTILAMQPRVSGAAGGMSREEIVRKTLEDMLDLMPEAFDTYSIMERIEQRTPYNSVLLQECDRMNILLAEMRTSMRNLTLGLNGDLTITEAMEALIQSMFLNTVPTSWERVAYPSLKALAIWFTDLQARVRQLQDWSADVTLPKSVWLGGLFNPASFLTAIQQTTARRNEWPLDRMTINTDVTKKWSEDIAAGPRDGAYIHGLYLEGCRWDSKIGGLADSRLKDLYPAVPVIHCKAVTMDKKDTRDIYTCPIYSTRQRGPTVWTFGIRSGGQPAHKWVLAGVGLLLAKD